jgi:hypothetical protein
MKINIHQSHLETPIGKSDGKVCRNGTFPDTAFAAHHQDFMLDFP